MKGYLALVLHAHLPFVRHPEHEVFFEESWLYEALTETYIPLLQTVEGWHRDGIRARIAVSLSPTLVAMFEDPLLCERYSRRIAGLVELAEKETLRLHWQPEFRALAEHNLREFQQIRATWQRWNGRLVAAFKHYADVGFLELITCGATHAVLPLLAHHTPSLRAQVRTACDHHAQAFGQKPLGFWLPECAYTFEAEPFLREAGVAWFIVDTHGLIHARPTPAAGCYAPVVTPRGSAVFGRDLASARQVWSRHGGYPGDFRYREFYRDIGFDLDLDYVGPYVPCPGKRGFVGIKYHRITGPPATNLASPPNNGGRHAPAPDEKAPYNPAAASAAAQEHARHFLETRVQQLAGIAPRLGQPPILVAPYDAELFGHWWHEGWQFLDALARLAHRDDSPLELITPTDYLRRHPRHQIAQPSPSTWGEAGYLKVWVNERNAWVMPHLRAIETRMTDLCARYPDASGLTLRALNQAARELMLAQASDWPFMLHTGSTPEYARARVRDHVLRFLSLHEQLVSTWLDETRIAVLESSDNLFPRVDYRHWQSG